MSEGLMEAKAKWWMEFVKQIGLPTAMLIVVGYGIWQGSSWFANNLAKPLFDKQMKLFDEQSEMISETEDAIRSIAQSIEDSEQSNDVLRAGIEQNRFLIQAGSQAQLDMGSQQLKVLTEIAEKIQ